MAELTREFSEQETRDLIAQAMQKSDGFKIRVQRRRPGGGIEVIALFEEATADHASSPEKWLPELAGGGTFILHVFHLSAPMTHVGGALVLSVDNIPPRQVDIDATLRSDWVGPRGLSYPKKDTRPKGPNGTHVDGRVEVDVQPPPNGTTPLHKNGGTPATSESVYWMEKAQKAEEREKEAKTEARIEAIRREADARVKSVEDRHATALAEWRRVAETSAAPRESMTDALGKMLAPLAPVLQSIITANNDMKLKMLEIEQKNAERALQAAKENNEMLQKFLLSMNEKKGIDPALHLLIEHLSKKTEQDPVLKGVIESFSAMAQSTLQVMTAATDAGLIGQRESGTAEIVTEVARAAGSFFEMMAARPASQATLVAPQQAAPTQRLPAGRPPATAQQPQRPQPQPSVMQRLDAMVKAHHNPAETAKLFILGIQRDADLRARFAKAGNDIEEFFKQNWGPWAMSDIPKHGPYVTSLHEAVLAEAQARGLLRPPPGAVPVPGPVAPPPPPAPVAEPVAPSEEAGTPEHANGAVQHDDEPADWSETAEDGGELIEDEEEA